MNRNGRDDDAKLAALDRFMVDQILNASDEEILAEAEQGDVQKVENAFRKAKAVVGKAMMAKARADMAASKTAAVVPFDRARMRQKLDGLVASQGEHGQRLTLAARGAKGNVDGDDEGILDDLNELLGDRDGKDPT